VNETITFEQIGMLLAYAATRDQRTVGDTDILAWHKDLNRAQVTYADAEAALDQYYAVDQPALPREHRYRVVAADIIATIKTVRSERLQTFAYEPPPTLDDPHFIERYRSQISAVASGTTPAPAGTPMLTGGPAKAIADSADALGRRIPADDDPVAKLRKLGPLGYECPECHAAVGRRCRNAGLGKPRKHSHPLRLRVAAGKPLPTPEELAAEQRELDRRIAASRARLEAEGRSTFVPPGPDGRP
jgi:hypothetical protein